MDPERWRQATALFNEALDLPREDRAAWLDQRCAGDQALRNEVASLLRAHEAAGDFIEIPAIAADPDALFEQHALAAGDRLGPFTIERLIARGGMGVVYLARDTRLDRQVALKLVPPDLADDAELRERLHREARAAATLSHPAIARVFALEEIGSRLVIVSEFVEGQTLRSVMRGAALPLHEVYAIAIELTGALQAAHDSGIVHRDLKPDNIMRHARRAVESARLRPRASSKAHRLTRLTATGIAIGTPGYMSPEQREGGDIDRRTDIYAMGVLLCEMATGRLPFGAGGPAGAARSVARGAAAHRHHPPVRRARSAGPLSDRRRAGRRAEPRARRCCRRIQRGARCSGGNSTRRS